MVNIYIKMFGIMLQEFGKDLQLVNLANNTWKSETK